MSIRSSSKDITSLTGRPGRRLNFKPEQWGSHFWHVLHIVSLGYPDEPSASEQRAFYDFFYNIKYILPCEKCRVHYHQNLEKYDLNNAIKSKKNLVQFVVNVHNSVNRTNGKREWTVEQMIAEMEDRTRFGQSTYHPVSASASASAPANVSSGNDVIYITIIGVLTAGLLISLS